MDITEIMSPSDVAAGLLCATVIVCAPLLLARRSPDRYYIWGALVVKLTFCLAFCAMTITVFRGADAAGYHDNGIKYARLLGGDLAHGTTNYLAATPFFLPWGSNTERIFSLSGLVHYLTFNSFIASSMVFTVIGFLGQLHLYRTFTLAYPSPRLRSWWRAGILFMPSLSFWSAALLKDPVGLWGVGCTLWGAFSFFKWNRLTGLLRAALGIYTLLLFRAQVAPVIVLAIIPMLVGTWSSSRGRSRRGLARAVQVGSRIALLAGLPAVFVHACLLDNRLDYNRLDDSLLQERSRYRLVQGGSTILEPDQGAGVAETSFLGILPQWPESVVFCLYRPFLWESFRSPVVLFAGLENTVLLVLTLRALSRAGSTLPALAASARSAMFLSCLIFVAVFAFALGLSTPNLGSISRYRIPVIPFFVGALLIFEHHYHEYRDRKAGLALQRSPQAGFRPSAPLGGPGRAPLAGGAGSSRHDGPAGASPERGGTGPPPARWS